MDVYADCFICIRRMGKSVSGKVKLTPEVIAHVDAVILGKKTAKNDEKTTYSIN